MTEKSKGRDAVPEEFGGLIEEFQGLLEKYPDAARQFSLAFHPSGSAADHEEALGGTATTASFSQPVFECTEIEPGFVICRRVDEHLQ